MSTRSRTVSLVAVAVAAVVAQPALAVGPLRSIAGPVPPIDATPVTQTSPVRVVPSTAAVGDASGRQFSPDTAYAVGGAPVTSTANIVGTASPTLYQHERIGGLGYTFPVSSPGTYFVDLFLAETQGSQPGGRVWDVTAEDGTVAESVDAARDAGPNTAWHLLFAVPVVDGALDISFTPDSGVPLVGAVEVDYQNSSVTPRTLFTDDFNGPAGGPPDAAVWGADVGGNGWGNNELETYTKRPANLATDGAGSLAITARREEKTGADGITRNYTSGRLLTRDKFEFQYGTADARLRMPDGRGLLSGFWMLGSNAGTVGWPLCGEMDVVENVGSEPAIAHATVHAGGSGGTNWLAGSPATASEPLAAAFHTYGLVWGPNALGMTLDGRSYMTISASDIPKTSFWNFNHPFYLLLDLAVGGNWPGPPDAGTVFPARLWVDYVRVTG